MRLQDLDNGGLRSLLNGLGYEEVPTVSLRWEALEAMITRALFCNQSSVPTMDSCNNPVLGIAPQWLKDLERAGISEEGLQILIMNSLTSETKVRPCDKEDLKSFSLSSADATKIFRQYHPIEANISSTFNQLQFFTEKPVIFYFDPNKMSDLDLVQKI